MLLERIRHAMRDHGVSDAERSPWRRSRAHRSNWWTR
jgi:hypothetical protein